MKKFSKKVGKIWAGFGLGVVLGGGVLNQSNKDLIYKAENQQIDYNNFFNEIDSVFEKRKKIGKRVDLVLQGNALYIYNNRVRKNNEFVTFLNDIEKNKYFFRIPFVYNDGIIKRYKFEPIEWKKTESEFGPIVYLEISDKGKPVGKWITAEGVSEFITNAFPKTWNKNLQSVNQEVRFKHVQEKYGSEGVASGRIQVIYSESEPSKGKIELISISSKEQTFRTLAHEICHLNDGIMSMGVDIKERFRLIEKLEERIKEESRFVSDYVESIKNGDKGIEEHLKAIEYFAEVCSEWILDKDLPEKDRLMLEDWVSKSGLSSEEIKLIPRKFVEAMKRTVDGNKEVDLEELLQGLTGKDLELVKLNVRRLILSEGIKKLNYELSVLELEFFNLKIKSDRFNSQISLGNEDKKEFRKFKNEYKKFRARYDDYLEKSKNLKSELKALEKDLSRLVDDIK